MPARKKKAALPPPATPTPRNNWVFTITCVDCLEDFDVLSVSYSTTLVNDRRGRMAVLTIPNECPKCHNLTVVG